MSFHVIIPARYEAARFPGKVLCNIKGKPMLQWVYEQALQTEAEDVYIATDDERVERACQQFAGHCIMTGKRHKTGTERLAQAAEILELGDDDIVVNVQGDEPLIPPEIIVQVAENLQQREATDIATLCHAITSHEDLFNPDVVKVVFDRDHYAMYFSRAPIPWARGSYRDRTKSVNPRKAYRHVGLYAYRVGFLKDYASWKQEEIEMIEALEQLRALYRGHRIHVDIAKADPGIGIDTEEDLKQLLKILDRRR